jgi:hypothetical protein
MRIVRIVVSLVLPGVSQAPHNARAALCSPNADEFDWPRKDEKLTGEGDKARVNS